MTTKIPVDVKKCAEILNVEESTAYGFLRMLAELGIVETSKRPQPEGKKGKPATLYIMTDEVGSKLHELIRSKLAQLAQGLNVEAKSVDSAGGASPAVAA